MLHVIASPASKNRRLNPYGYLLYDALARQGVRVEEFRWLGALGARADILHFHWPEQVFNSSSILRRLIRIPVFFLILTLTRLRRERVFWTVHNLFPDNNKKETFSTRAGMILFTHFVDGWISLSRAAIPEATRRYPALARRRAFVIPHGHYRDEYPAGGMRSSARAALGIPAESRVISFIGQVRRYKNVTNLIRAFRQTGGDDLVLLVAGCPESDALASHLRELAKGDARARLDLRFLGDLELSQYVTASDLVALPYSEILNSGSALLALSLGRPVLVPGIGAMNELAAEFGPQWVRTFTGDISPTELAGAVAWAVESPRPDFSPYLNELTWEGLACQTLEAYRAVISDRGRCAIDTLAGTMPSIASQGRSGAGEGP